MEINVSANNQSSPQAKIALFRSFFRGREEVYPKRFENKKTGKSGYVFACGNEWVRGICEKPKIKCSDCKHRRLLPITDDVVHWHLSGQDNCGKDFVMGIYPMLLDETCFFLAADFDKASWTEDATAFLKTCHQMGLPAALERSRSGKGAHVWLFFSKAITAGLARKLVQALQLGMCRKVWNWFSKLLLRHSLLTISEYYQQQQLLEKLSLLHG
jgi:hypothetical protein